VCDSAHILSTLERKVAFICLGNLSTMFSSYWIKELVLSLHHFEEPENKLSCNLIIIVQNHSKWLWYFFKLSVGSVEHWKNSKE
jgi:hypothetical protein